MADLKFPKTFLWGAATAAHQVEGGQNNDWARWEQSNHMRLADEAGNNLEFLKYLFDWWPQDWESNKLLASDPNNYLSGNGVDHYYRYKEDFQLLKELNLKAFRFSIEWARVEPQPGKFDEKELDHYRAYLEELIRQGIKPFVTLNHFTLPLWVADQGGWKNPKIAEWFQSYTQKVNEHLGDLIEFWLTINEPMIYATATYLGGDWPPAHRRDVWGYWRCLNHMCSAHTAAYRVLKSSSSQNQISIVLNLADIVNNSQNPVQKIFRVGYDWYRNKWLLTRLNKVTDFVAMNHYFFIELGHKIFVQDYEHYSDLGWTLNPESLGKTALATWQSFGKPVYITEHGLADAADSRREWFIRESLKGLHSAIEAGADVRGYLHWSLLDNFEWAQGWWPKFGLVAVERETQARTIRDSAKVYGQIAKQNAISSNS